jgi:hypothetical protein
MVYLKYTYYKNVSIKWCIYKIVAKFKYYLTIIQKMFKKLMTALAVGYSLISPSAHADLLAEQRCYYTGRSALIAPGAIIELNEAGCPIIHNI